MAQPKFDIESALSNTMLPNARLLEPLSLDVEGAAFEHEALLPPEPEGPRTGVRERQLAEHVPNTHQLLSLENEAHPRAHDLARDLIEFQEAEHRRILGDDLITTEEYFGLILQVVGLNRRQEIISEFNRDREDHMDSEPDEEYSVQDDEDVEVDDQINEKDDKTNEDDLRMPPADDPSQKSSPDLQMQEADKHEDQGGRRSEKPFLRPTIKIATAAEEVSKVQYPDSITPDLGPPAVNGQERSVQAELLLTEADWNHCMVSPNHPTPIIEEIHTEQLITQVNPSSSRTNVRTLGASPTSPTHATIVLCNSSLDLLTSAATHTIAEGEQVQKPAWQPL